MEGTMGRACEGRVALITGASRGGTGTVSAIRLAAEGAKVAITARNVEGLASTRATIEDAGGTVLVLPCDLADPAGGRDTLVARTEEAFGPVDILINNAATGGFKRFYNWTLDELDMAMQVNVYTPWTLMQHVLPGMRERGEGWIVNLTTFCAEYPPGPPFPSNQPATGGAVYGTSKAALNRLTLSVASENLRRGVAVNALTPQSAILTPDLIAAGYLDDAFFEPLDTMAEAVLLLATCDPTLLNGRIAYSLQLLYERRRPVYDVAGESLVEGWQPDDLPAVIARQAAALEEFGWTTPFEFHRPSSPDPVGAG
jgi:NAD(P)-dependent dehydrogenase (short-subunit alcohol dehydrogenase family)